MNMQLIELIQTDDTKTIDDRVTRLKDNRCINCGADLIHGERRFDDGLCCVCWLQKCRGSSP